MPLDYAFRGEINRNLKDPAWRSLAFQALEVLDRNPQLHVRFPNGEQHPIPFRDIYCQASREQFVHFEDLVITAFRWQQILNGTLIYSFIQLGGEPHPDADVEGNRRLLKEMVLRYRGLYGLVDADFWGGKEGADGYVKFERPFIVDFQGRALDGDDPSIALGPLPDPVDGTQTRFPLEVGYCMPHQIDMHFWQCGCVARFPYGHDIMIFIEAVKPLDS